MRLPADVAPLLVDPAASVLSGRGSVVALREAEVEELSNLASLESAALAEFVAPSVVLPADGFPINDPLPAIGLAFALQGDLALAGEIFRGRLRTRLVVETMRLQMLQQRQKEISRRDRPDGLQELLIDLVREKLDLSAAEALDALRKVEGGPVVDHVSDRMIEWRDANTPAGETPIRALPSRLTRARKKVSLTG